MTTRRPWKPEPWHYTDEIDEEQPMGDEETTEEYPTHLDLIVKGRCYRLHSPAPIPPEQYGLLQHHMRHIAAGISSDEWWFAAMWGWMVEELPSIEGLVATILGAKLVLQNALDDGMGDVHDGISVIKEALGVLSGEEAPVQQPEANLHALRHMVDSMIFDLDVTEPCDYADGLNAIKEALGSVARGPQRDMSHAMSLLVTMRDGEEYPSPMELQEVITAMVDAPDLPEHDPRIGEAHQDLKQAVAVFEGAIGIADATSHAALLVAAIEDVIAMLGGGEGPAHAPRIDEVLQEIKEVHEKATAAMSTYDAVFDKRELAEAMREIVRLTDGTDLSTDEAVPEDETVH